MSLFRFRTSQGGIFMSKRNLRELRSRLNGKIYVYLKDGKTAMRFLIDAENEGYSLGGRKPTECETDDVIALGKERLSYVGFTGRVAFQCGGGGELENGPHRIDYDKYKKGEADYYYREEEFGIIKFKSEFHGMLELLGSNREQAQRFLELKRKDAENCGAEEKIIAAAREKYDVLIVGEE